MGSRSQGVLLRNHKDTSLSITKVSYSCKHLMASCMSALMGFEPKRVLNTLNFPTNAHRRVTYSFHRAMKAAGVPLTVCEPPALFTIAMNAVMIAVRRHGFGREIGRVRVQSGCFCYERTVLAVLSVKSWLLTIKISLFNSKMCLRRRHCKPLRTAGMVFLPNHE